MASSTSASSFSVASNCSSISSFSPHPVFDDEQGVVVVETPRHRLSFSGFPSLDHILSIDQIDRVPSRSSEQWVVRVRGKFTPEKAGKPSAAANFSMTSSGRWKSLSRSGEGNSSTVSTSFLSDSTSEISQASKGLMAASQRDEKSHRLQQHSLDEENSEHSSARTPLAPMNSNTTSSRSVHTPPQNRSGKPCNSKSALGRTARSNRLANNSCTSSSTSSSCETPPLHHGKLSNHQHASLTSAQEELNYEVMIDDKDLVSFCGIVLKLLKRELETSPNRAHKQRLQTLPQLREAFNNLISCTDVPKWLSQRAREVKQEFDSQAFKDLSLDDLENRKLSFGKQQIILLKDKERQKAIEEMNRKFEEEKRLAMEKAAESASKEAEREWKRKLSLGRREAIELTARQAAAEKAGIVNFAKQCVRAIAILKDKLETGSISDEILEEEKRKAVEEAENEWKRRLSFVRKETVKTTSEQLSEQFRKKQQEEIKHVAERVRAETEADWALRLQEEQRNRRLSCQLKLTAAVERTSKRAAEEREAALAALAEELEREKVEATRVASEAARAATEQEWKRKLDQEIRQVKESLANNTRRSYDEETTTSGEDFSSSANTNSSKTTPSLTTTVSTTKSSSALDQGASTFELQREERVWYGAGMRRFSIVEHPVTLGQENGSFIAGASHSNRVSNGSRLFRGLSQDFSTLTGTAITSSSCFPPIERPKRVSFVLGKDLEPSTVRDFSTEFSLPSPIPIVPMPLDDTAATSGMTPLIHRNHAATTTTSISIKPHSNHQLHHKQRPPNHQTQQKPSSCSDSSCHSSTCCSVSTAKQRDQLDHHCSRNILEDNRANDGVIQFHIEELLVQPGELRGPLTGRYREYNITTLVSVGKPGSERQQRTRKTMRYSEARDLFKHELEKATKKIGVHDAFETLIASFPPKSMRHSNSMATAKFRAQALQGYILAACEVCARLLHKYENDEEQRTKIRSLLGLFFGDFLL